MCGEEVCVQTFLPLSRMFTSTQVGNIDVYT